MKIKTAIKEIFQTAAVSLIIFFFIYIFIVQPHRVKGESMFPSFKDGELLLVEKVTYRVYAPSRGDVIVFRAPGSKDVDFIKRIVGLAGETIKVENGSVYINGIKLEEPYLSEVTLSNLEVNLGQDEYFVMGDNRDGSTDSRAFGPIKKKTIEGKAWFVYWPIFKNGISEGARILYRVNYGVPDSFYDR